MVKNNNYGFIKANKKTKHTQLFQFNNLTTSHLAKVGVDYYINDNNTVSFLYQSKLL
jgi:hypothetical protein